ncbi:hypothetical protein SAMN05518683_11471 [Salibacterium halotolerans]|uniref:Uncharacterized protein n=1 Tax=Salibacterium halotolerans TaxID=1884432 RepID=A0A1I5UVE2_9BACI|nr:hypothetical protein SAMN05518683_11471 [Salibacterium halotolerans]
MAGKRLDLDKRSEIKEHGGTRPDDMYSPFVHWLVENSEDFAHLRRPKIRLSCVRFQQTFEVDRKPRSDRRRSYRGNRRK